MQLRYGARSPLGQLSIVTATIAIRVSRRCLNILDRKGYDATGIVKSPASIARLEDTRVFPPLAKLYDWRARLQREIDTRFAPETAGVLDAALLGNRYNLSQSASERFREGGTFTSS